MRVDLPFGGYVDVPEINISASPTVRSCYPFGKFLRKLLNPFESIEEACGACTCSVLSDDDQGSTAEVIDVDRITAECEEKKVFIYERIVGPDGTETYQRHGPFDLSNSSDMAVVSTFQGKEGFFNCF
jgi:hypothetical protein